MSTFYPHTTAAIAARGCHLMNAAYVFGLNRLRYGDESRLGQESKPHYLNPRSVYIFAARAYERFAEHSGCSEECSERPVPALTIGELAFAVEGCLHNSENDEVLSQDFDLLGPLKLVSFNLDLLAGQALSECMDVVTSSASLEFCWDPRPRDKYSARARRLWELHAPLLLDALADPVRFFAKLGREIEREVDETVARMTRQHLAGLCTEDFNREVARIQENVERFLFSQLEYSLPD